MKIEVPHRGRAFTAIVSQISLGKSISVLVMRRISGPLSVIAMLVILVLITWDELLAQQPDRLPEHRPAMTLLNDPIAKSFQNDATLRSIACISSDRVVAVGDRGTVLLSSDAGRSWKLVPTPCSANLHDVKFSGEVGYAVGGWIGSETGCSYATMIRSTDGGESWQSIPAESLPRLTGLQLLGNRLLCWGDFSVQHNSCVFISDNSELAWSAATTGLANAATAAANAAGQIAAVDQLGLAKVAPHVAVQTLGHAQWSFNTLLSVGDRWLAAGENGELVSSTDGLRWEDVPLPLPAEIQHLCSWNCMENQGSTIWLAGSPGSIVLRSGNSGGTWEVLKTGQNLPINKVSFIDSNRGWAVGPLGTILATRDGGLTWYAQRKQPDRLGLLTISTDTRCIPWLAGAAAVWDKKRAAAALVQQHAEPIARANARPSHESVAKEVAGQIGLAELHVCDISADEERTALQRLAMHLATWRPDVVLYSSNHNHFSATLAEPVPERSISKAIQLAGSPEFQELLKPLHLDSWSVSKLVVTAAQGKGEYLEDADRVLKDCGLSLRDTLNPLPHADLEAAAELSMLTTWCRSQSRSAQTELLGGVALQPTTQLTSKLPSLGNFQMVMGRVHRERALRQLMAVESQLADSQQWLAQLRFFLPSVPERELPDLFVRLTDGLLAKQQWEHTELVLEQLISADHGDVGLWASDLYLQLCSTAELRHWIQSTTSKDATDTATPVRTASYQDTWSNTPFSSADNPSTSARNGVVAASTTYGQSLVIGATSPAASSSLPPSRLPFCLDSAEWTSLAEMVFKVHPRLRVEPRLQMQLAKQLREADNRTGHRTILNELAQQSQLIGWSQAAKQELAVLDHRESQLKWRIVASMASDLPKLDGVFDESFWNAAARMQLTTLSGQDTRPAEIAWAYDLEYLYLAIRCPHDRGQLVKPLVRNRSYDADLTGLDHVELMIDVDRDYGSTIDLAVAENGLTSDRCLNLPGFNPKWHVGMLQQKDAWQAEVAIKLDTLVEEIPQPGTRWAISARRIRPDQTPQSWSQLRTHQRLPESAGLLMFE